MTVIQPGATIGILGGGQLGRMIALAAREMGYRIVVLEPKANSSAGQIADEEIIAPYDDAEAIAALNAKCDVVTFEFENVDAVAARPLEEAGKLVQGTDLLKTTQHRLREKEALEAAGLPVAKYQAVRTEAEAEQAVKALGAPSVLKTCRGGYDGKGQVVIEGEREAAEAFKQLQHAEELVMEQWIPFHKEVSVIVSRTPTGEMTVFPVAENDHQNNILHQTFVPARVSPLVHERAVQLAQKLARHIQLVGTLAVEMFVTENEEIYVNELAPRPHNSGHYSLDACTVSQFTQHIRSICNWPLIEPEMTRPVVMTNVLGEHVQPLNEQLPRLSSAFVHLYDKGEARPGRKMGHVNVIGASIEEAIQETERLTVWDAPTTING
ncbi:5-(carboxyamino)imidazole ribonucleotide synthase [Salsuginibacillus kocurii]|uniref:5-(carboxyamino)imidazole ribonucleotide synthase n=1 Tax=Salsuginibacillus kocurii TaxID=427078 RepID=UPI000361F9C8|nr:5-(carboxyamino)imidazole ribonucleotide synthase [Salsuginibacillus kocurii]